MDDIGVSVVEETESTYLVHLLNADAEHKFSLHCDLAEREELRYTKDGISHGDAGSEFIARLKEYGNKLYDLLLGGAVGEEFGRLSKDGFCLRLHLPPNLEVLPWEYLATEGEFLFKSRGKFLIRKPSLEESAASTQDIVPCSASCHYIKPA